MGKKKDKEESQEIPQRESDGHSASAGIFNTLFGSAPEQTTASSIFSHKNPFRRKPQESASGLDTINDTANPSNGSSENHAFAELKKRKRNIEKNSNSDLDSASEAFEKKLKLVSESNSAIALTKEEKNKASEIATESNDISNEAEKKRKRKRDELEKEWESKMYGTAAEEEDEREGLGNKTVGSKRKALYNPADMLVSKEGFDDEDKLLRTIFVGNLPIKVKKKTLLKEFKKFGEVESVRIRSVPILDTKKPRKGAILSKKINDTADSVHAYIVFKTEQAAQASLSHNMAVVGGNHIRVDRACPPRKKHKGENAQLYDNKRTVFVGNLPFDVKDEELYQLFSGLANLKSSIEAVRVIRDPHINVGKGIAYVLFKTREAANLVVKKRNLKLRDRELRISHARADATPSKRPSSSASHAFSTPAKKLAGAPSSRSPASTNNRSNRNINMSYQGLRATKTSSQNQKKFKTQNHQKFKSQNQKGEKSTERKNKRPAVAARKAKAQLLKNGGSSSSKQAGTKRKQLDSWSPDNSHRNKKFKNN